MHRVALVALLLAVLAGPLRAQQPNVVLVTVDDLNTAVGFLSEEPGNPLGELFPDPAVRARVRAVLTPNLDRLAAQSVPFASAHATNAICAPSRAAMLTGIRPHVSGFYSSRFRDNPVLAEAATLPEYLREHGYYTAGVGKIFHDPTTDLFPDGTLERDGPDEGRSWDTWINRRVSPGIATEWSPWSPNEQIMRFGSNAAPLASQSDVQNASVAVEALRTGSATLFDEIYREDRTITLSADRPFFLAVGPYRPHLPWVVPDELLSLFDAGDLALTDALREAYFRDTDDVSAGAKDRIHREGDVLVDGPTKLLYEHGESIDPDNGAVRAWKEAVMHYLAGVAQSDRIVGQILDALDAGPYAANTVLIVVGDHGMHLGEKAWFGKTTLWEESTVTPLLIRLVGGAVAPGQLRRQPVSLADVFPTVLALTGVPPLDGLGGVDLAPLLADPEAAPISTALTQMGLDDHTLRTDRYRYIRYNLDPQNAELYDLVLDPLEHHNVITDPAYATARIEMETALGAALAVNTLPVPISVEPSTGEPIPMPTLGPASPNPSRGAVTLRLSLSSRARVRWEVVDALGRVVWHEDLGANSAGEVLLRWRGASAGVYTARAFVDGEPAGSRRIVLTR